MSQDNQILNHLKSGNTITALESINLFGCYRLASVINRLRNQGEPIEKEMITTSTGKRVAEYRYRPVKDRAIPHDQPVNPTRPLLAQTGRDEYLFKNFI